MSGHSKEIEEVIGRPPFQLLRLSLVALFAVVVVLVFLSWLIRYPDVLEGRIKILPRVDELSLYLPSGGQVQLVVNEKQRVDSGEVLAYQRVLVDSTYGSEFHWVEDYPVVSPVIGTIVYVRPGEGSLTVNKEDKIVSISLIKPRSQAIMEVPAQKAGKLRVGHQVVIELDAYPAAEHGTLTGYIDDVSYLEKREIYILIIDLKDGLVTNHNVILDEKLAAYGKGKILTENKRYLYRLLRNN